jgi:two-component system OmpR family sensor kinase
MSSNQLTDSTPAPRSAAHRRGPTGWPLRTRLVAIMIALLAILGLIVGATSEIYLHKSLYDKVNDQLDTVSDRALGGPPVNGKPGEPGDQQHRRGFNPTFPPGGAQSEWIIVGLTGSSVDPTVVGGGKVAFKAAVTSTDEANFPSSYTPVGPAVIAKLAAVTVNGGYADVDLGDLGDYRVVSKLDPQGTIVVSAIPLREPQSTLLQVALVTAGAVVLALVIAGWAGAFIIRRTLMPLSRVAATATKVSELKLDHGEVDLAQRVHADYTDIRTEVGQVGAALNKMLDHVGSALEARHASEMQVRQFVADASHELRTPLAAIRGYAELSRRSRRPVPDEIAHVLRRVESEAKRMTALVEDLLLLARLDAGRPLANDPVDLSMLVVDAVSDAHAAGPQHNWQLDLPNEPVTVIGDQQRLHQVLANLLANARTHTPEGTYVTVAVTAARDVAVIRVIDSGPGIPPELQPHIFERFARGDSSRSRAAGSTGLGLSIVNAVVTAHGGEVSVQSRPGQTQFTVLLPLALPAAGPAPISPHAYARITP